jgi:hypothetical protein
MRFIDGGRAGRNSGLVAIWLIALAAGLLAVDHVVGSSSGPTAVASKKKCKKARWKCAPKRYHLTASGIYANCCFTQNWSAEVDLGKRRASPGEVDYAQNGGTVTVSATGTGLDDHCTSSSGDATFNVPRQTVAVPRGGSNDADFGVTFMLIGSDKNTYGLSVGDIQPEFSDVKATVIVTCPEGTSHTHEFPYTDPDRDVRALVARGRVGASSLTASAHTRNSFVAWTLSTKK